MGILLSLDGELKERYNLYSYPGHSMNLSHTIPLVPDFKNGDCPYLIDHSQSEEQLRQTLSYHLLALHVTDAWHLWRRIPCIEVSKSINALKSSF